MTTYQSSDSDREVGGYYLSDKLSPGRKLTIEAIPEKYRFSMALMNDEDNFVFDFTVVRDDMLVNYCLAPCHGADPSTQIHMYRDVYNKFQLMGLVKFEFNYVSHKRLRLTINDYWEFYLSVRVVPGVVSSQESPLHTVLPSRAAIEDMGFRLMDTFLKLGRNELAKTVHKKHLERMAQGLQDREKLLKNDSVDLMAKSGQKIVDILRENGISVVDFFRKMQKTGQNEDTQSLADRLRLEVLPNVVSSVIHSKQLDEEVIQEPELHHVEGLQQHHFLDQEQQVLNRIRMPEFQTVPELRFLTPQQPTTTPPPILSIRNSFPNLVDFQNFFNQFSSTTTSTNSVLYRDNDNDEYVQENKVDRLKHGEAPLRFEPPNLNTVLATPPSSNTNLFTLPNIPVPTYTQQPFVVPSDVNRVPAGASLSNPVNIPSINLPLPNSVPNVPAFTPLPTLPPLIIPTAPPVPNTLIPPLSTNLLQPTPPTFVLSTTPAPYNFGFEPNQPFLVPERTTKSIPPTNRFIPSTERPPKNVANRRNTYYDKIRRHKHRHNTADDDLLFPATPKQTRFRFSSTERPSKNVAMKNKVVKGVVEDFSTQDLLLSNLEKLLQQKNKEILKEKATKEEDSSVEDTQINVKTSTEYQDFDSNAVGNNVRTTQSLPSDENGTNQSAPTDDDVTAAEIEKIVKLLEELPQLNKHRHTKDETKEFLNPLNDELVPMKSTTKSSRKTVKPIPRIGNNSVLEPVDPEDHTTMNKSKIYKNQKTSEDKKYKETVIDVLTNENKPLKSMEDQQGQKNKHQKSSEETQTSKKLVDVKPIPEAKAKYHRLRIKAHKEKANKDRSPSWEVNNDPDYAEYEVKNPNLSSFGKPRSSNMSDKEDSSGDEACTFFDYLELKEEINDETVLPFLPNIPANLYDDEEEEEIQVQDEEDVDPDDDLVFADFSEAETAGKPHEDVCMDEVKLNQDINEAGRTHMHQILHGKNVEHFVCRHGFGNYYCQPKTEEAMIGGMQLDLSKTIAFLCAKRGEPVFFNGPTSCGKTFLATIVTRIYVATKKHVLYIAPTNDRAMLAMQNFHSVHKFSNGGLETAFIERKMPNSLVTFTSLDKSLADLRLDEDCYNNVGMVIVEDFDLIMDKSYGKYCYELMEKLRNNAVGKTSGFLFTSNIYTNIKDYAGFFAKSTNRDVHVITSRTRPFFTNDIILFNHDFHNLVNPKTVLGRAKLFEEKYLQLMRDSSDRRNNTITRNNLDLFLQKLMEDRIYPAIIVADDDQQAEEYFTSLASKFNLISLTKKERLKTAFKAFIEHQSHRKDELAIVQNIFPLIARGIGLVHSSLPAGLVEITRTCFKRGYLLCLVMTKQTVKRGLDKAKTVVIPSIEVRQGGEQRLITAEEVEEMTAVRGFGNVTANRIFSLDTLIKPEQFEALLNPEMKELRVLENKSFANILDNFEKSGSQTLENYKKWVFEQSFTKYDSIRVRITAQNEIRLVEDEERKIDDINFESEAAKYVNMTNEYEELQDKARRLVVDSAEQYLSLGRVVYVRTDRVDLGWAVIVGTLYNKNQQLEVYAGLGVSQASSQNHWPFEKLEAKHLGMGDFVIRKIPISSIYDISTYRLKLPTYLEDMKDLKKLGAMLDKLIQWDNGKVPKLRLKTSEAREIEEKCDNLHDKLTESEGRIAVKEDIDRYRQKLSLKKTKMELQKILKGATDNIADLTALEKRVDILRRLGYLEENDEKELEITQKGETAKGILVGDEILLYELGLAAEEYQKVFGKALMQVFGGIDSANDQGMEDDGEDEVVQCVKFINAKINELKSVFGDEDPVRLTQDVLMWDINYGNKVFDISKLNTTGLKSVISHRINTFLSQLELDEEYELLEYDAEYPVFLM
ncbi:unnamed protein product [Bursaphelenchus okinawaensis]|uniref:DEAD/DEAH-box helicase domain-containing protein n=1 Tax=Bursaphelenchus okinawaensis TaxID=465554 RepID=A0A811JSD9_9BILA|nr:unnamed protein product [Bursaphelenchus okinawaensis]CAG9080414.1 unnamed protein product [Bursaphelenchus okinawaensis]